MKLDLADFGTADSLDTDSDLERRVLYSYVISINIGLTR